MIQKNKQNTAAKPASEDAIRAELIKYFDAVEEDKRWLAVDALDEYLYFRAQLRQLQRKPLIRVDKNNPAKQKITAAGKLIKDYSNVIDAKRAAMFRILSRSDSSAADELLKRLSEFE